MSSLPPLLMIAEGRKPRLRKAPVERSKEIALHMAVAKLLRQHARSDWQWTHIDNGEVRDPRTAAKLKQMGLRPGWPDFVLVPPTGRLHCLDATLDLRWRGPNELPCDASYRKGEELGYFHAGSTILVFADERFRLAPRLAEGVVVRMGEPLLHAPPGDLTWRPSLQPD